MRKLLGLAACGIAIGMTAPVQADTKTADGLTYRLTAIALTSTEDQFTLTITGINGSSDTEMGRCGAQPFAFQQPSKFVSANAPVESATADERSGLCKSAHPQRGIENDPPS
jgi:hypothetical protein